MTDNQALANLDAAAALARALAAQPPRRVVVSPGARSAPLVLAMHQEQGLAVQVVLDERAAAFVALGLAVAERRAVVLVCTSGSAGGHWLPAMMEAHASGIPLVAITADRPEELHHRGALQTTAQTHLFFAHVLRGWQLPTPTAVAPADARVTQTWGMFAAQALYMAEHRGPGPVHLNAPFCEPLVPTPAAVAAHSAPVRHRVTYTAPSAVQPDGAGYQQLCDFLADRKKGIIVCGPLPVYAYGLRAREAVAALAHHLGWPVLGDALSGLRFGPSADATFGAYDASLAQGHLPPPCDGALVLGDVMTSKKLRGWLAATGMPIAQIHRPGRWQDPDGITTLSVGADMVATCEQLLDLAKPYAQHADHCALWAAYEAQGRQWQQLKAAQHPPFAPANLWPVLLDALPAETRLHVGSSMPVRDLDRYGLPTSKVLHISSSRGLNGIDGTVATVTGLALAHPHLTVGVMGELTFLHDVGALQAARQFAVQAILVVINNGGGAIFDHLPVAAHTEIYQDYFRTPQQADIGALCRACACEHEVVYTPAALKQALADACARQRTGPGRVVVIEAILP
jgi:2-succinyl-5-enolpyruvyl-6-hydroxy-3-cyclohexene-1-carboxylate synthase